MNHGPSQDPTKHIDAQSGQASLQARGAVYDAAFKPVRRGSASPDVIYLLDSDSSSDDELPVVEMYVYEPGGPTAILD